MATIAGLVVMLGANIAPFAAGMASATKPLRGFVSSITSAGRSLAGLAAAAAAVVAGGAFAMWIRSTLNQIDNLNDQATALGISTDALSRLQYAARFAGVESEALSTALAKMLRNLDEARAGTGPAADAFRTLGLDAAKLATMSPDQAFMEIADAINQIQNPAQRVSAAMDLFGKAGAALLPLMAEGKEGLKAWGEEADKTGNTIRGIDAATIARANDSIDRMGKLMQGAANTIAIQLAPFIEAAAGKLFDLGTTGRGITGWIVSGFELVAKAIAWCADVVSLFKAVLKLLQSATAVVAAGIAWAFNKAADGIVFVFTGIIDLINAATEKSNQLLGTDFSQIEFKVANNGIWDEVRKGLLDEAQKLFIESGEAMDDFAKGKNAKAVTSFFDDLKAKAAAASEIANQPIKPAVDTTALKKAAEDMEKVRDTLETLREDAATAGLSDSQKKLGELRDLGATDHQLGEAERLMSMKDAIEKLNSIDTGDAMTDFASKMEQLQKLYAQGAVTAQQFEAIRKTAKQSLTDALTAQAKDIIESFKTPLESYQEQIDKLNTLLAQGLINEDVFNRAALKARETLEGAGGVQVDVGAVRSGSAEAEKIAFDSARGVQRTATKDEIAKKSLTEQEKMSATLTTIAVNTKGSKGTVLAETDL